MPRPEHNQRLQKIYDLCVALEIQAVQRANTRYITGEIIPESVLAYARGQADAYGSIKLTLSQLPDVPFVCDIDYISTQG